MKTRTFALIFVACVLAVAFSMFLDERDAVKLRAQEQLPHMLGRISAWTNIGGNERVAIIKHWKTGACFIVFDGHRAGSIAPAPKEACE